jgi:signal peptidase I
VSGSGPVIAGAAAREAAPRRALRSTRERRRHAIGIALTLVVLGAVWWLVAPPQLGGSTTFVVVDGASMLPRFHRSDLVALRPASSPGVGDVVGYRSAMLRRVVLHRIIAVEGNRYIVKGDNNSFVDPEKPRREELVGTLWFRVPSAGHVIGALKVPWVLAALAALLVLVVGLDGSRLRTPSEGRHTPR